MRLTYNHKPVRRNRASRTVEVTAREVTQREKRDLVGDGYRHERKWQTEGHREQGGTQNAHRTDLTPKVRSNPPVATDRAPVMRHYLHIGGASLPGTVNNTQPAVSIDAVFIPLVQDRFVA